MDNSFDRVMGTAIHDVAVPQGLAERIVARLAQQEIAQDAAPSLASVDSTVSAATVLAPAATVSMPWFKRRRSWLVASAGFAVAASLLMAVWLGQSSEQLTPETVMDRAREFYSADAELPVEGMERGVLLSQHAAPSNFPLPAAIVNRQTTRWRRTKEPFLRQGCVAFDLSGPNKAQATLYVIRLDGTVKGPTIVGATTTPPSRPMASSRSLAIATWNAGDRLLYVLVVNGGQQAYQLFVQPSGAMAQLSGEQGSVL